MVPECMGHCIYMHVFVAMTVCMCSTSFVYENAT